MSIAEKITSIEEHIGDIYNSLELGGSDLTNVNKNIVNIDSELIKRYKDYLANGTDAIWNNWDKIPLTGVNEATLNNTIKAKMLVAPKGDTKQAILPSEYQQVEYIESTGTQYIDTGVVGNQESKIDIDFAFTANSGSWAAVFGGRESSSDGKWIAIHQASGQRNIRVDFGLNATYLYTDIVYNDYNKHNIVLEDYKLYVDGVYVDVFGSSNNFSTSTTMAVFCNKQGSNPAEFSKARVYSLKLYDGSILVRNFIPCYRKSDNEIGLYDLVNNVFYTNAGTGTFLKGSDIPNPSYPQEIKNVKGKNVFDKSNAIDGEYYESNGSVISDSDYCRNDNYVYCAGKPQITMSGVGDSAGNARLIYYDKDKNVVDYWFVRDRTIDVPDTVVYIRISVLKQYKDTLQVEFNSEATPYVPGNSVQIKVQNKNLFDKNNANIINAYFSPTDTNIVASSGNRCLYIPCKPNTTYAIQKMASSRFRVGCTENVPADGVSILNSLTNTNGENLTSIIITSTANSHYLVVWFSNRNVSGEPETNTILDSIQIEERLNSLILCSTSRTNSKLSIKFRTSIT